MYDELKRDIIVTLAMLQAQLATTGGLDFMDACEAADLTIERRKAVRDELKRVIAR